MKSSDVETGIGDAFALACHPVRQVDRLLQARVSADQVAVIDIGVIQVAVGLHLGLHGLHDLAFTEKLVVDLDAGDFLERFGQSLDSYSWVGMVSDSTLISIAFERLSALMNQSISFNWSSF